MTTTAEATAPAAKLTQRQLTLRLARLIRKGLPGPVSFRCRSVFAANAQLAAAGREPAATRPGVDIYLADRADFTAWASALDLRVECEVYQAEGKTVRHEFANGIYEGWSVFLSVLTAAHLTAPFRPRRPAARRRARTAIAGRLV